MNKKYILFKVLITFILIAIIPLIIQIIKREKNSMLNCSCINHLIQLIFIIHDKFYNNDSGLISLPYDNNLPGYAIIAKINDGSPSLWINCNHGAPKCWYGGWQYLNLPTDAIYRLNKEWEKRYPDKDMPIIWCGKGNTSRMSLSIFSFDINEKGIGVFLCPNNLNFNEFKYLNDCLQTIGEKKISFDIPDSIDWGKYLNNNIENYDASPDPKPPGGPVR